MWISVIQADQVLQDTARDNGWSDLSTSDKTKFIKRASDTINIYPFNTDTEPLTGSRYTNGFASDANGFAITSQPIPENLRNCVAVLAHWYFLNPKDDLTLLNADIENSLSPFVANLPAVVQQCLWPYLTDEYKGFRYFREISRSETKRSPRAAPIGANDV